MTMNPLPPQAYTKDTLLKAYQWLMGQNSSIKEISTTPDILVSLYLKATRDGDSALERPSIQNFKNELRNLAGMMGELDRSPSSSHPAGASASPLAQHVPPEASLSTPPPVSAPVKTATSASFTPSPRTVTQQPTPAPAPPPGPTPTANMVTTSQTPVPYTEKSITTTTASAPALLNLLDCETQSMIREVKNELNLSSEVEALRMLVKIGYKRSQSLIGN